VSNASASHDLVGGREPYRWGEDGLAGICDDRQILCFAPALWNGRDPILKERLFGLTKDEGNHGEDVKEYYFYLDSTWSWSEKAAPTPTMRQCRPQSVSGSHPALGNRYFLCDRHVPILFTDNETNRARVRSKPKRSNCTS
jgi:hypothetical protein